MNQVSIVDELIKLEKPFGLQNNFNLVFKSECLFGKQQIQKNEFTLKTAENNTGSLRNAILNVAAVGVSLNPALAHAYLVPRDGSICLDISYRGLVKLATDSGAIEWAKSILVYEADEFKWRGPTEAPLHEADVFAVDRMNASDPLINLKGGYCLAKLKDGSLMVDVMTAGEILEVRDSSKAKKGPWAGKWAGEMAKKTLVKRASKSWPQSSERERMDVAINVLNEHEGLEASKSNSGTDYLQHSPEQLEEFKSHLKGEPLDYFLWYQTLDDLIKVSLINSFTTAKGKGRELANNINNTGRELFMDLLADLTKACEVEDEPGAREVLDDLPQNQQAALVDALDIALVRYANQILSQATQ
ncbi:MAG: recombinase RecT [Robiginitomaculum sp.]|nr:recombinase RecT [Robiginitomaculum sp.]